MSMTNRRKMLEMLAAVALIPALAPRNAAAQASGSLIAPPPGTMRFERSIIRQLNGGTMITVTRQFQIGFRHFADGFIIEGEQVAAEVVAPANLAAFADLERARIETGMFPVTLDPFGQLRTAELSSDRGQDVDSAFIEALAQITNQPIDSVERGELHQFVSALHQAGAALTADMPIDLFAPSQTAREESRTLPLPTGDFGHVISRFDATRDAQTGLMRRAAREVLTEIDGDRRHTIERWQLDRT